MPNRIAPPWNASNAPTGNGQESRWAMSTKEPPIEMWVRLVRSEYLESPGLSLTREQAKRLWALEASACDTVLAALLDAGFLRRTGHGRYVRNDSEL
jgi:hypothetical protein